MNDGPVCTKCGGSQPIASACSGADARLADKEASPQQKSFAEWREEFRAIGGDGWDNVDDVEALIDELRGRLPSRPVEDAIAELDMRLRTVESKLDEPKPAGNSDGSLESFEAWVESNTTEALEMDCRLNSWTSWEDARAYDTAMRIIQRYKSHSEPKSEETPPMILNWDTLRDLPDDLAEAIEQCKLSIIRHRADNWRSVSQETFIAVFGALAKMVADSPSHRTQE